MTSRKPNSLMEAIEHFADPEVAFEFVKNLRWPDKVVCPNCGHKEHYFLKTRGVWKCKSKDCRRQFSIKVGTIFEDSRLSLGKWLAAIWMIANAKNGVSSYEIHRSIGVTQKTAWFMMHRIRAALKSETFEKLKGHVEVDESYIGGKAKNQHYGKRTAKGRGPVGKAIVMGLLERHGEVRASVIPDTKKRTLHEEIKANVVAGTNVYTDEFRSYVGLDMDYAHKVVNHAETYVDGEVYTNGIENFWSLFKRCIKGTYVSVDPFHLQRYLDEEVFRFNNRKVSDGDRFALAVANISSRRLTWKELAQCPAWC